MRAVDEREAAANRLLAAGPVAGLAFPAALLLTAGVVAAAAGDAAGRGFLTVAAPALLAMTIALGEFPSVAVVIATSLASAPLWMWAGRWLARAVVRSAPGAPRWTAFWRRYALAGGGWSCAAVALLAQFGP